jgi:hypothetical protein
LSESTPSVVAIDLHAANPVVPDTPVTSTIESRYPCFKLESSDDLAALSVARREYVCHRSIFQTNPPAKYPLAACDIMLVEELPTTTGTVEGWSVIQAVYLGDNRCSHLCWSRGSIISRYPRDTTADPDALSSTSNEPSNVGLNNGFSTSNSAHRDTVTRLKSTDALPHVHNLSAVRDLRTKLTLHFLWSSANLALNNHWRCGDNLTLFC